MSKKTNDELAAIIDDVARKLTEAGALREAAARLRQQSEDSARLDYLQGKYPRQYGWVCRDSTTGRGWRLHQSKNVGAHFSVREAIDKARKA